MAIKGSCLCGSVRWQLDGLPESATVCNCTACRRYGSLWAYGHQDDTVRVAGDTTGFVRRDDRLQGGPYLATHFCPTCGNLAYWRGLQPDADGRRRIAVNLRLADEPHAIAGVPIQRFDGLDRWEDLPPDGRCVQDLWF